MAENGILDYQGMNQAIYRGATSNIVVDTQSMSIEIGAGNTSHTSNLHFECNHDANVASIQLNSNVVMEFSRSKKLIKYPRVALTSASTPTGYVVDVSNQAPGHSAWEAFDNDADSSNADHRWRTDDNRYTNNSSTGTPSSPTGAASTYLFTGSEAGDWISVEFPEKMKIVYYTITGIHRHTPYEGVIYGYDTVMTTWERVSSFINPIVHPGDNRPLESPQFHKDESNTKYYSKYAMIVVKTNGHHAPSMYEWKLYGVQEYDSEAHGTDVTVKSVANVPNTDWLEVYYDAKDLGDGAVTNPISGLGGTTINGTAYGNPQISGGAFDLDGTGDYITTAPLGFSGDQAHSISIWFRSDKPQTDMTTEHGIYSFGYANNLRAGLSWWSPVTQPNSSLRFWHSGYGGKNFPATTFLEDIWNHVVVVYPGGGATSIRIWLNGVERMGVDSGTNSAFTWSASDSVSIGDWYSTNGVYGQSPWDGKIANFRLFNRAITLDEIYQIYAYQKEYFGHGDLSMTLKAGRLGIGTSEPRAALDVRGRITREYNPGEIIEELNAICDGSTIMVQSGSYTMSNITAYQTGSTSHQVITGSTINYTPPPGTKRVYYRFWFKWDAYRNSGISHFQFQIDDVLVTPSKSTVASNHSYDTSGNGHHHGCWPMSVEYTIDCNATTDDASNGKFKSWTGPKELECTFRDYNHTGGSDGLGYRCLIHVNEWTDGTGTDSIQKPHLTIRAIA